MEDLGRSGRKRRNDIRSMTSDFEPDTTDQPPRARLKRAGQALSHLLSYGQMLRVPVVLCLVLICCLIELTLEAADAGLVGSKLWRSLAYQYGAFWEGLLYNWRPNYGGQPALMFLSYAFLHADIWHMSGNMLALLVLARLVLARTGQGGFLVIYGVSALGGALVFALLAQTAAPMVGASGALFGLAGGWQYWEWRDLRQAGLPMAPIWRVCWALILLNGLLWVLNDGALAWQTHLGGFVFGWGAAMVLNWGLNRWQKGKDLP